MNLLETLQAHKGGLICLKTELYWYDRRSWDGTPGRICLILDATASDAADGVGPVAYAGRATNPAGNVYAAAAAVAAISGAVPSDSSAHLANESKSTCSAARVARPGSQQS